MARGQLKTCFLFSISKPSSATNKIISELSPKLFAPKFALEELHKYRKALSEKSGREFNSIIKTLKNKVKFVNESEYSDLIEKFKTKISDDKDLVYLALASKLKIPIWSNDPHLKEQSEISVLNTPELISSFELEI